jgi:hypothetical protein
MAERFRRSSTIRPSRELIEFFGGLSVDEIVVSGHWEHGGQRYRDALKRLTVTGEDT